MIEQVIRRKCLHGYNAHSHTTHIRYIRILCTPFQEEDQIKTNKKEGELEGEIEPNLLIQRCEND